MALLIVGALSLVVVLGLVLAVMTEQIPWDSPSWVQLQPWSVSLQLAAFITSTVSSARGYCWGCAMVVLVLPRPVNQERQRPWPRRPFTRIPSSKALVKGQYVLLV